MLAALMLFAFAACGTKNEPATSSGSQGKTERTSDSDLTSGTKLLVVYFSRTGEQYNVGTIDKGNTAIVAEMIAEKPARICMRYCRKPTIPIPTMR